jgi:hypothetical protein
MGIAQWGEVEPPRPGKSEHGHLSKALAQEHIENMLRPVNAKNVQPGLAPSMLSVAPPRRLSLAPAI